MFWISLRYRFPYFYFFLLFLVLCFPFPQSILPPFHLPNLPPIVFPLTITFRILVFLINSTKRIYKKKKNPHTSFGKCFTTRDRFSLVLWHKWTVGESASCSKWINSGCLHQKHGYESSSAPVQLLCCELYVQEEAFIWQSCGLFPSKALHTRPQRWLAAEKAADWNTCGQEGSVRTETLVLPTLAPWLLNCPHPLVKRVILRTQCWKAGV